VWRQPERAKAARHDAAGMVAGDKEGRSAVSVADKHRIGFVAGENGHQ
jgi:hypothetical protein